MDKKDTDTRLLRVSIFRPLRLSEKSILLVAIPVVFLLLLFREIVSIQQASELFHDKVLNFREVIDDTDVLLRYVRNAEVNLSDYGARGNVQYLFAYQQSRRAALDILKQLYDLNLEGTNQQRTLHDLEKAVSKAMVALANAERLMRAGRAAQAKQSLSASGGEDGLEAIRQESGRLVQEELKLGVTRQLELVALYQRLNWLMGLGIPFAVFVTMALAIQYNKWLIGQLLALAESARKAASGEQVFQGARVDTSGSDEIAELYEAIKSMNESHIPSSGGTQKSLENVSDLIFTLDSEGKFVSFTGATLKVLGYGREELLGRSLDELVVAGDIAKTSVFLGKLVSGATVTGFENSIKTKDGLTINLMWFAYWSQAEKVIHCVAHDVTARKTVEAELRKSKELAESASLAKSTFLAHMSHEIRTPLSTVIGMTRLALDTPLSSEQREYLTAVRDSADTLISVVGDVLDFSQIEAGKFTSRQTRFNLSQVLGSVVNVFAMRAKDKGLQVKHEIAPGVPVELVGDCDRLRQILLNLVGNAVKFTRQGEVLIRVQLQSQTPGEATLLFSVADTGPGISKDGLSSIFDPFVQGIHVAYIDQPHGAGLGLTISARLVEMLGGRIWVESEISKGSSFYFTYPVVIQDVEHMSSLSTVGATDASCVHQHKARAGLNILVAEDDILSQRMITRMLEKGGHTVEVVNNGFEAVEGITRGNFNIVLMDLQMPGLDGYQATGMVRQKETVTKRHMPIIALTAYAIKGEEEKCLEAGMDGYITKPIDMDKLFRVVEDKSSELKQDEHELIAAEVIDLNALQARVCDDKELLQELVQIFLEECPKWRVDIRDAMGDSKKLQSAAHKIRGSLQNLSALAASEAARKVESKAQANDLTDVEFLVACLDEELERLVGMLSKFVPEKVS